MATDYFVDKIT